MKRKFVLDEELNLLQGDNDLLNTKVYAKTLEEAILNTPKDRSFTIGLFGEWGSGKSSIINTVQKSIEERKTKEKIKFITYDAWKYANDSFRRMFLLQLQKDLNFKGTDVFTSFYLNENEDIKIKKKVSLWNIVIIVLVLIIGLVVINIVPYPQDQTGFKLSLPLIVSFAGLLVAIFFRVFDDMKVSIQKPHFFAPEQFENCFNEMVCKSMKSYNVIQCIHEYFTDGNHEKNIDKLVIVIDNIDRCHKELSFELLTNIKNFLGNKPNVIFIIPVDDEALKRHILNINSNGNAEQEAAEFLRKFFNVTIRIKPYQVEELYSFTKKINDCNQLDFTPNTIYLIAREYASNPRRIIQFFNDLSMEIKSIKDTQFAKQHEAVICKLLIIREEFPDFYEELIKKPSLIGEYKDHLTEMNANGTKREERYNEKLKSFLDSTKMITHNLSGSIIERILSNSNVFEGITSQVRQAVADQNIDVIFDFIGVDGGKQDIIVDYLIKRLKEGLQGKVTLWSSNTFELILQLNQNHEIKEVQNVEILEIIKDSFKNIIPDIEDYTPLVDYCCTLINQKRDILTIPFADYIEENYLPDSETQTKIPHALSYVYNTLPTNILYKFNNAYLIGSRRRELSIRDINPDRLLNLIEYDDFLDYIIENISLGDTDPYQDDMKYILGNIQVKDEIVGKYIDRVNTLIPDFTESNAPEIHVKIAQLNDVLILCKSNDITNYITGVINIFNKINHVQHIAQSFSQQTRQIVFVISQMDNEGVVDAILNLCFNTYRLTKETVSSVDTINKILQTQTNRSVVNGKLLALLKDTDLSLSPYFNIILQDSTYDDNAITLLKRSLLYEKSGVYSVSDESAKNKLKTILDLVHNDDNRKLQLINLLDELVPEDRISKLLRDLIPLYPQEVIAQLSQQLQTLAIDIILDESRREEIESNIPFLCVIAQYGHTHHIKKLVPIINSKMLNSNTFDDAINIILCLTRISKSIEKSLSSNLELVEQDDGNKEAIINAKDHIQQIIK